MIDPILNRMRIRHALDLIKFYDSESEQESGINQRGLVANLPQAETGAHENR